MEERLLEVGRLAIFSGLDKNWLVKQNSTPEVKSYDLLRQGMNRFPTQVENRPTFRLGTVVEEGGGGAGHGVAVDPAVGAVQQVRRRRPHRLNQRRRSPLRLSNPTKSWYSQFSFDKS